MAWGETIIRENESKEELWNTSLNKDEQNALDTIQKESVAAGIEHTDKTTTAFKMNDIVNKHFSFSQKSFDSESWKFEEKNDIQNRKIIKWIDSKVIDNNGKLKNMEIKFIPYGTYGSTAYDTDLGVKKNNTTLSDITKTGTKKLETKDLMVLRDWKKFMIPSPVEKFKFEKWDMLWYQTNGKTITDVMERKWKEPRRFDVLQSNGELKSAKKIEWNEKKYIYVESGEEVVLHDWDKILNAIDQQENINKNMELFYQSLMKDLRSQYESLTYEKDGEEKINEVLDLMVFYVNTFALDDKYVRDPNATLQQKEESVKRALREMKEKKWGLEKTLVTDVRNDEEMKENGYVYKETQTSIEVGEEKTTNGFYRLPMADLWKEAMDKNFDELKKILDQPGVKILWYDVVGYASTVPYEGSQKAKLSNGEVFDVTENSSLSKWRMLLSDDWLKTNYADKFEDWFYSNLDFKVDAGKEQWVDYNDPAHPEYKERSNTAEWREKLNTIFWPYQWVDIKVNYRIDKEVPKYVYEKEGESKWLESYNNEPKARVIVTNTDGSLSKFQVSGRKLNQDNPEITWSPINELIMNNNADDMWVDGTSKWWSAEWADWVVTNQYNEYLKYSKEDPQRYPPITDPKSDISWVDKINWTNKMKYWSGESVRYTPVLALNLSNPVHNNIYTEMQSVGFWSENGITTEISDKYLEEKINKRTKMYVKDGIQNRKTK